MKALNLALSAEECAAYVNGDSAQKIADRLGCSDKPVRDALRRAGVVIRPASRIARNPMELFWSHVEKVDGGCWLWQGARSRGYGAFESRELGGMLRTHRLSWTIVHGPIPNGLYVLHRCDNPPCCNPDHLFLGTNQDNVDDMVAKGRNATKERNGSSLHPERKPRGEKHWKAKLTSAQVADIRAAPRQRGMQTRLARQYGVCVSAISRIILDKTWVQAAKPISQI